MSVCSCVCVFFFFFVKFMVSQSVGDCESDLCHTRAGIAGEDLPAHVKRCGIGRVYNPVVRVCECVSGECVFICVHFFLCSW